MQLGIISHFLIDPRTATVVYLSLRAKGLGGQDVGMVPLSALTQIGGVVRVHDESAVMDDEFRSRGLVKLVGHSVQSYDGTPLGKVCQHFRSRFVARSWPLPGPAIPEKAGNSQLKLLQLCTVA